MMSACKTPSAGCSKWAIISNVLPSMFKCYTDIT